MSATRRSGTTARGAATSESEQAPARPLGVVLAGGAGRRLGGAKATAVLRGRPLIAWPLAALGEVLDDVVVVAKGDTVLPPDLTAPVWVEPDAPRHPIAGLLHALAGAGGRSVLVCAVDLPGVTAATVARLAGMPGEGAALAVDPDGRVQPLLGRYPASAADVLRAAASDARLTDTVLALRPTLLPAPAAELRNVNTPEDLAAAEAKTQP